MHFVYIRFPLYQEWYFLVHPFQNYRILFHLQEVRLIDGGVLQHKHFLFAGRIQVFHIHPNPHKPHRSDIHLLPQPASITHKRSHPG